MHIHRRFPLMALSRCLVQLTKSQRVTNCRCSPLTHAAAATAAAAVASCVYSCHWLDIILIAFTFVSKHLTSTYSMVVFGVVHVSARAPSFIVVAIVVLHRNGNCHHVNFMWHRGREEKKTTNKLNVKYKIVACTLEMGVTTKVERKESHCVAQSLCS